MKECEKAKKLAFEVAEELEDSKEYQAALAALNAIPEESKEPEYKTYDDPSTTIFEIFGEYGKESKIEIDGEDGDGTCDKELYYDFTPFNAKDPVLLSLMTAAKY